MAAITLGLVALRMADAPTGPLDWTIFGALAIALCVGGFGLLQDARSLPDPCRTAGHLLAAGAVAALGITFDHITLPFVGSVSLGVLGYPLTVMWLAGLTDVMRRMDRVDGVAGSIGATTGLMIALIAWFGGDLLSLDLAATAGIATLGLLAFQLPVTRVGLGNVGSQFLGFGFALIGVLLTQETDGAAFLAVPLLFAACIADLVITRWLESRRGGPQKPLFERLHCDGAAAWQVAALHAGLIVVQGCAALLFTTGRTEAGFAATLIAAALIAAYATTALSRERWESRLAESSEGTSRM